MKITNEWIKSQVETLWNQIPFKFKEESDFFVDVDSFNNISTYKDKIVFLMRRYNLPYENVNIYMHSGLDKPGFVQLQKHFDTEKVELTPGQQIISIQNDGTYLISDYNNPTGPIVIKVNNPPSLISQSISIFLNQDFLYSKEIMGAIIAHEISHVYLYFNRLQQFNSSNEINNDEEELRTDITAFAIGLGALMLRGCKPDIRTYHRSDKIIKTSTKIGYLPIEQMNFVHNLIVAKIKALTTRCT